MGGVIASPSPPVILTLSPDERKEPKGRNLVALRAGSVKGRNLVALRAGSVKGRNLVVLGVNSVKGKRGNLINSRLLTGRDWLHLLTFR